MLKKPDGTIVINCMDPRLQRKTLPAVRRVFSLTAPPFYKTEAGGAKVLADRNDDFGRRKLLVEIALARRGGAREVVILSHTDCFAYKCAGHVHKVHEKEVEFHIEELRRAAAWVRGQIDMKVRAGVIRLNGSFHLEQIDV